MLRQVLRAGSITWHRVEGAIAVYLLMGLLWAFAYDIVELLPGVILPEVADLVLPRLSVPLLAGGFIRDAAAVRAALAAGAMAVTTSERALWN